MIEEIYKELRLLGAVRNIDQFSREWLGMEKSYMRVMKAKGRKPSAKVIATCAARLRSHGKHLIAVDDRLFKQAATALNRLADSCIDDMIARYEVKVDAHQ